MITRLYVDNYRCFVNFEWKPGKLALILGDNGAGKTAVLDVVWALRGLVIDEVQLNEAFPESTRTRWGELRPDQTFELDVLLGGNVLRYRLVLRHEPRKGPEIVEEILTVDGNVVSELRDGDLEFKKATGEPVHLTWSRSQSAMAIVTSAINEGPIQVFGDFLFQTWIVAPDPRAMSSKADKEARYLERNCSNFAAWLRRELVASPEGVAGARAALHHVMGLKSLQVPKGATQLMACFEGADAKHGIDFEELSDGQRQLIVLHVLRHVVFATGRLVVFDEPDNYVALREIQPWLTDVINLAFSREGPQVWFISHHSEVLNQLAREHGHQFVRLNDGPVRIEPFPDPDGLTPAELVAGGWNHDDRRLP